MSSSTVFATLLERFFIARMRQQRNASTDRVLSRYLSPSL